MYIPNTAESVGESVIKGVRWNLLPLVINNIDLDSNVIFEKQHGFYYAEIIWIFGIIR